MAAAAAWSAPAGSGGYFDTAYHFTDRRECFDDYQDRRNMEGALDSAMFWQMGSCGKEGFQVTDEAGVAGCRAGVGGSGVACTSLDPSRAAYERLQQKIGGGVERQMAVPDVVADYFGDGADLDDAYRMAGMAFPVEAVPDGSAACGAGMRTAKPAAAKPMTPADVKAMRLSVNGGAGGPWTGRTTAHSMSAAAAYKGGKVVSVFADGVPPAYAGGHPAAMPEPGRAFGGVKGATMYVRNDACGSGPSTLALTPVGHGRGKDLYAQAAAALRHATAYACEDRVTAPA